MSGTINRDAQRGRELNRETSSTVEKALSLVELAAKQPSSLAELTATSGFSRSTTHRLASLLVKHSYLEYQGGKYSLGTRFLELGERKRTELHFMRVAQPIARRYSEQTGETVHLAVLQGTDMQLTDKIIGARQLQVNSFVGQKNRAYRTAVGKAMIAAMPEEEWTGFLSDTDEPTRTRLLKDLRQTKMRGYAIDVEESNVGVCCVAAAIEGTDRQQVAAVSFNGASVYLTAERINELAPIIVRCAREVEEAVRLLQ